MADQFAGNTIKAPATASVGSHISATSAEVTTQPMLVPSPTGSRQRAAPQIEQPLKILNKSTAHGQAVPTLPVAAAVEEQSLASKHTITPLGQAPQEYILTCHNPAEAEWASCHWYWYSSHQGATAYNPAASSTICTSTAASPQHGFTQAVLQDLTEGVSLRYEGPHRAQQARNL